MAVGQDNVLLRGEERAEDGWSVVKPPVVVLDLDAEPKVLDGLGREHGLENLPERLC